MGENEMRNTNAQDMNHILKARYDKLKELQEAQTDPFVITTAKQTHHSEDIQSHFSDLENKEVAGRSGGSVCYYQSKADTPFHGD